LPPLGPDAGASAEVDMLTEWSAEGSAGDRAALELALTVTQAPDGPVVVLDGGLVSGPADRLLAVADELLDDGRRLTIDLACLALLDSAGVNVLLTVVDRAASHSMDLRLHASPTAADLLERTGVAAGIGRRAVLEVQ
jgi:ABC-type transporter Mla MlaB component